MTSEKKPIDQAVDLALYAPIGFALEAKRLLPSFVERGRQQVNMAKVVGKFAVTQGQSMAAQRITKVQGQAEQLLAEFGLAPQAPATTAEQAAPAAPSADEAPATDATDATAVAPPSVEPTELPIAGYDSLAASQVVPRLDGLTAEELDAVERYEAATRGRKTILGKIAQLRAG